MFCSAYCSGKQKTLDNIYSTIITGIFPPSPKTVRLQLEMMRGWICSICGNTEWLGKPIPLVMDHRDGNPENWSIENIRFVCGNCDMQLPTYKGRNKGNGRFKRLQRYRDGLSY